MPEMFDEPDNCPKCGARRQWNVDNEIVHARAGTYDCPTVPVPELHPHILMRLAGLAGRN
jgi:hypothetical protein